MADCIDPTSLVSDEGTRRERCCALSFTNACPPAPLAVLFDQACLADAEAAR